MSIKVIKTGAGIGCNCIKEFLCDTTSDVANLPTMNSGQNEACAAGSLAIVAMPDADAKRILILDNQGEWK